MNGDDYMDAVENMDPRVCETHGHIAYTVVLCDRCGAELKTTSSEGTDG